MSKKIPLTDVPFVMTALNSFAVKTPDAKIGLGDGKTLDDRIDLGDQARFQQIAADYGFPDTKQVAKEKWRDFVHDLLYECMAKLDVVIPKQRISIADVKWDIERARLDFAKHGFEECWTVHVPSMTAGFQLREIQDQEFFLWQLTAGYGVGVPKKVSPKRWEKIVAAKRAEYAARRDADVAEMAQDIKFRKYHRFVQTGDYFTFGVPQVGEQAALKSDPHVYLGEVLSITGRMAVTGHSGAWNKEYLRTWDLEQICQWPDMGFYERREEEKARKQREAAKIIVEEVAEIPATLWDKVKNWWLRLFH